MYKMYKLALDICRCISEECPTKLECLRYTDIPDQGERFPFSSFYTIGLDTCTHKIKEAK